MDMHYLGANNARRVPMNQDEFDTKFNFLKESRARHFSVDENDYGCGESGRIARFCGICCRDNDQQSAGPDRHAPAARHHSAMTHFSPAERGAPAQVTGTATSLKRTSLGGVGRGGRGASTVTVPIFYETRRPTITDDEIFSAENGAWKSRSCFVGYFPLIDCLQRYSFRKDFSHDLRAGFTLALYNASEGFALAFLAGLPPMLGVYTAFCSAFIYMFIGTSPTSIMGGNIAVCFFVRNIVERVSTPHSQVYLLHDASNNADEFSAKRIALLTESEDRLLQIAATLTFLVALFHSLIYVLRLEFVFSYLSHHLLAGFFLGISFRILYSQAPHILSIHYRFCDIASDTKANGAYNDLPMKNRPPSYIYCMFWALYRRVSGVFGVVLESKNHVDFNDTNTIGVTASSNMLMRISQTAIVQKPSRNQQETCISTVRDCLESLNVETLAISMFAVLFLIFARQVMNPILRRRLRYPISTEFVLVLLAALISKIFVHKNFDVETLTYTSEQLHFTLPRVALFSVLSADALAVALLTFSIHVRNTTRVQNASARRNNTGNNDNNQSRDYVKNNKNKTSYNNEHRSGWFDERQELFAFMIMGAISCLAGAHPAADSERRAKIANSCDVQSTIVNISLALTLLPLIVWWPMFTRHLPVCILSCILLMNLRPLFAGIAEIRRLWHVSRIDLATFTFAALSALFLSDLSRALFASLIFAASTVVVRLQWPSFHLLVNVTGSGAYYAEKTFYGSELDESGVAVLRYEAPILFNNVIHFRSTVMRCAATIKGQLLGVGIGTRAGSMKSMKSVNTAIFTPAAAPSLGTANSGAGGGSSAAAAAAAASCRDFFATTRSTLLISGDVVPNYDVLTSDQPQMSRVLILDFSAVFAIDACGIGALNALYEELARRRTRMLLASASSTIRTQFKAAGGFEIIAKSMFFPSVHDAVLYAQQLGGVVAPSIHMSVSMNGCRDLIALSSATSHMDVSGGVQQASAPVFLGSNFGLAANTATTSATSSITAAAAIAARTFPSISETASAPQLVRSQSGDESFADLTIGSNSSQPPPSLIQQSQQQLYRQPLERNRSSMDVAIPTLLQQQTQLTQQQQQPASPTTFATKLSTRHSNS